MVFPSALPAPRIKRPRVLIPARQVNTQKIFQFFYVFPKYAAEVFASFFRHRRIIDFLCYDAKECLIKLYYAKEADNPREISRRQKSYCFIHKFDATLNPRLFCVIRDTADFFRSKCIIDSQKSIKFSLHVFWILSYIVIKNNMNATSGEKIKISGKLLRIQSFSNIHRPRFSYCFVKRPLFNFERRTKHPIFRICALNGVEQRNNKFHAWECPLYSIQRFWVIKIYRRIFSDNTANAAMGKMICIPGDWFIAVFI